MMNPRSIQVRLVAWSAVLTGVVVLAFGAYTYQGLQTYSREVVETIMLHRAEQIGRNPLMNVAKIGEAEVGRQIELLYTPGLNDRFVRVSRQDGRVIYQSGAPLDRSFDPAEISGPPARAAGKTSRIEKTPSGAELIVVAIPIVTAGGAYLIESGTSLAGNHAILHGLAMTLAAGLPIVLLLAVLGAYVLVRQALSPVQSIMDAAREISLYHLSRRLPVPRSGDELESLSRALNEMIARLDESFQHTSRFTSDASHELRTPLTIMRGELEALLARAQLPAESATELGSVLEETMRLARTVEGLFALSRLDAGEARAERVRLDLAELVSTTVEQMCLLAEERQIDLRCETAEPVQVLGDRSRLKQVVVNLLDNAIKYTATQGWVILRVRSENGRALLEVEDNGAGITAEDLPHVFERFYRSDKARSGEAEGAGLGLSIVQSICHAHGGTVQMENLQPQGCRVTVSLPAA